MEGWRESNGGRVKEGRVRDGGRGKGRRKGKRLREGNGGKDRGRLMEEG